MGKFELQATSFAPVAVANHAVDGIEKGYAQNSLTFAYETVCLSFKVFRQRAKILGFASSSKD